MVNRPQIGQVFFRADYRRGACRASLSRDRIVVFLRVLMVVAKGARTNDLNTPVAKVAEEGIGIPKSTECESLAQASRGDLAAHLPVSETSNEIELSACVENRRVRLAANDSFYSRGAITACDDNDVGASQRGCRFAQAAGGEEMTSVEGIGWVGENDVNIARKLKVLKAIIQNEPLHAAPRKFPPLCVAISADAECNAIAQARLKQPYLIARWAGGRRVTAIAAGEDACFLVLREQALGEPENHRSFPGPTDGEVANADDHAIETLLSQKAFLICTGPQTNGRTVKKREREEQCLEKTHAGCSVRPRRSAMRLSERAVAPRLRSETSRAARPMRSRNAVSSMSCTQTLPSCGPLVTSTAARAFRNCAAISRKFSIDGPNTGGFPNQAGSRILCPPLGTSEPPTNTASANE